MIRALDRLDERYGGWLRTRPELGFLLIGLVFVVGTGVHAARYERPAPAPAAPPTAPAETQAGPEGAVLVGPASGDDVDAYVQARYAELLGLARDDPRTRVLAIVSFDDYYDAAEAAELVAGVDVFAVRYRLRAPGAGEAADDELTRGQVGVTGDMVQSVVDALAREAAEARAHAVELERMAATTDDPEFAETFRRDRDALLVAAAAAGPGCLCVYAVLVEGSYRDLAEVASRAGVLLVDPAEPGADPASVIFLGVPPA